MWRQAISTLLIFVMVLSVTLPARVQAARLEVPTDLHSHHALVAIDAWSGQVLMGEDQDKVVYPASTVKLMTAIVMLEEAKNRGISLNKKVKITSSILRQVEPGLSSYHMAEGEVYTLRTLMNMMLICSYGDATVAAAITIFGSVTDCVKAMNRKAKDMGLKNTSFDNVVGLDIGNNYKRTYSTAGEMAKITQYAMKNHTIAGIVAKPQFQVTQANGKKGRIIKSTNRLYSDVAYDRDLFQVIGSKTGTTAAAGYVFAATAIDRAGHKVISVYMGKSSDENRFVDTNRILKTIFQAVKKKIIPLRTETTYPVYLKGNGSTEGSMTWITCTFDKEKKLPKNKYKKTGYTFNGWNTKKDGSGTAFTGGAYLKNLIKTTKAYGSLYAQWKIRNYKISYHLDGGVNAPTNPSTYTVKNKVILAAPCREGYIFDGWYRDPELTEDSRITRIKKGSTGKVAVYAKWLEDPSWLEEAEVTETETGEEASLDDQNSVTTESPDQDLPEEENSQDILVPVLQESFK